MGALSRTRYISVFVHTHSGLSELNGCWPQEDQGRSIPSRVVKSVAMQISPFGGSGLSTAWRCPSVKLLYLTCAVPGLSLCQEVSMQHFWSLIMPTAHLRNRLGVQILQWHSQSVVESDVYSYPWVQSPCFVAPLFTQPDPSDGVRWVTVIAYRFAFFSLPYTKEMGLGIIRIYIFQLVPNHSSSLLPHSISASSWVPLVLRGASLIAQLVKNPPAMQETLVQFLALEDPLEKG